MFDVRLLGFPALMNDSIDFFLSQQQKMTTVSITLYTTHSAIFGTTEIY